MRKVITHRINDLNNQNCVYRAPQASPGSDKMYQRHFSICQKSQFYQFSDSRTVGLSVRADKPTDNYVININQNFDGFN